VDTNYGVVSRTSFYRPAHEDTLIHLHHHTQVKKVARSGDVDDVVVSRVRSAIRIAER